MAGKGKETNIAEFGAAMFDLDGTLIDTLKDIADGVNRSLVKLGYPTHRVPDFKRFIGDGREVLANKSLPESCRNSFIVDKLVDLINRDYSQHWADTSATYAGIPEMLDNLSERGIKLAILSNKPDSFTQQMVQRFLAKWKFEAISGALPDVPPKPNPRIALQIAARLKLAPEKILYAGDSDVDMQMASTAGMFSVGVLWGFRTAEELKANGARVLVAHPAEISRLFERT
jgi:phosphoglycolate phosphatase